MSAWNVQMLARNRATQREYEVNWWVARANDEAQAIALARADYDHRRISKIVSVLGTQEFRDDEE